MTEYVMEYDGWAEGIPVGEYLKVRDAMHARKREEIVRCRECEWFDFDICACKRRPLHMAVEPDGFCAWGKRKESE